MFNLHTFDLLLLFNLHTFDLLPLFNHPRLQVEVEGHMALVAMGEVVSAVNSKEEAVVLEVKKYAENGAATVDQLRVVSKLFPMVVAQN